MLLDLWRAWRMCLKGLDGRPACSTTYDITKESSRVAKEKRLFERVGWEADVFWHL